MIKNVEISIRGMTCGGCSTRIENFIGATEGVEHSVVNLIANKGYFRINESKLSIDDLCTKIQNMGFPCTVDVSLSTAECTDNSCITSLYAKFVPLLIRSAVCVDTIKSVATKNNLSVHLTESVQKKGYLRSMTLTYDANTVQIRPIFELIREALVQDAGVDVVCADKDFEALQDEQWAMRVEKKRAVLYICAASIAMLTHSLAIEQSSHVVPLLCTLLYINWVANHAHKLKKIRDAPMEIFVFFNASTCLVLGIILTSLEIILRNESMKTLLQSGDLTNAFLISSHALPASHAFARATMMLLTIHVVGKYLQECCKHHANTSVSRLAHHQGDRLVRVATAILPVPSHGVSNSQMILFEAWDSEISALVKHYRLRGDLIGLHHSSRSQGEPVLIQSRWRQKELLDIGDIMIVCSGDTLPCDGIILSTTGSSAVANLDESVLTGESAMVPKVFGHSVYKGSIVDVYAENKSIAVLVTKVGSGTRLGQIETAVKSGAFVNSETSRFVSKFVRRFLLVVCSIALCTWAYWTYEILYRHMAVPDMYGAQSAFNKISFIMQFGAAVIAMACPCAIGLAIPVAVAVTSSTASSQGIIIRDSSALWRGAGVDTIVLDKTGTLTKGLPLVSRVNLDVAKLGSLGISAEPMTAFASIVAKMESQSATKHAYAILRFIDSNLQKIEPLEVESLSETIGQGIKMTCATGEEKVLILYLGSKTFIEAHLNLTEFILDASGAIFLATAELGILATIYIAHHLDQNAAAVIAELQKSYEIWLCSGDTQENSVECAKMAGIAEDHVISQASPWDKERLVKTLTDQGQRVVMVGDGVNDSLAMSAARLGIAYGYNSDLLTKAAQVVIYRQNLEALIEVLQICHKASFLIKLNLTWAVAFNCLGIPVAAGLMYPRFWISSVEAAFCMALSSLLVLITSIITMRPRERVVGSSNSVDCPISVRGVMMPNWVGDKSTDNVSHIMRMSTTEMTSSSRALSDSNSPNCDINLRPSMADSNAPSSWFSQTV